MRRSQLRSTARRSLLLSLILVEGACARRYSAQGLVLRVDKAAGTMLVSHKPIPGFMPAMAMPVRVEKRSELSDLKPGDRVSFQLVVRRNESFARRLRAERPATILEDAGDRIRIEAPAQKLAVGAAVPEFSLIDQRGVAVSLSEYRGRVVAVNFIYTRCPLPDVCPRLSAGFARLQRRFQRRMGSDVALLSVTIDPTYDTPPVLARYAALWRADPRHWRFLTGPVPEIQRVAALFGLVYWPEEGLITHTSSTAVIGRDGRLAALVEGVSHTADQLGDLIEQIIETRYILEEGKRGQS